ncbi:minor tail protein [Microbacterium phage Zeta1847]|uniref:Minor tail protein n=1 Tax=Microbacterium phage Zeta1847 TaxID=2201444 RepID=A0A2Z4Q9B4_9CAUD|nr:minor tail protein [Microbacterium phage Zeta1847]AWY06652.1 minor tail protein [Microbacterium phage Zeta1847]
MVYTEGQLNGARDYRVGFTINYSGVQDWNANTSRFDWKVELVDAANYGSWTNATCKVWANIGGVGYYGTFTIPSAANRRLVLSGSTWHAHDGEGFRSGFASNAYIKVPHSNIGEGGSGDAWVDAPRIPKPPAKPAAPTFSNITTSNVRVTSGIPDNRGAAIDAYDFQFALDSAFTGATTRNHNGHVLDINPLAAGKDHWFRTRAHNSRGWGPWSDARSTKTKTALYFIDPDTDVAETVELFAWTGTAYTPVELLLDPELDGTFVAPA